MGLKQLGLIPLEWLDSHVSGGSIEKMDPCLRKCSLALLSLQLMLVTPPRGASRERDQHALEGLDKLVG